MLTALITVRFRFGDRETLSRSRLACRRDAAQARRHATADFRSLAPLDITDAKSVAWAVAEAGPIEVLVNNAGFGVPSPIELTEPETARALFETNTLGTLAMVQAVLPAFRKRRAGVIINVSSSTRSSRCCWSACTARARRR